MTKEEMVREGLERFNQMSLVDKALVGVSGALGVVNLLNGKWITGIGLLGVGALGGYAAIKRTFTDKDMLDFVQKNAEVFKKMMSEIPEAK